MKQSRRKEIDREKYTALSEYVRVLYVDNLLNCTQVTSRLKDEGHKVARNKITRLLKEMGIMRSTADQHRLAGTANTFHSTRICEFCKLPFEASGGSSRWCDACVPKLSKGESRPWAGYASKFGFSKAMYDEMLSSQGNACVICKKSFVGMPTTDIHLDHCHSTNQVRGILCLYCNRGIGCFFDNPDALISAAAYVSA